MMLLWLVITSVRYAVPSTTIAKSFTWVTMYGVAMNAPYGNCVFSPTHGCKPKVKMPNLPPPAPRPNNSPKRLGSTARGYNYKHQKRRAALLKEFPICQRCGAAWSYHMHHELGVENDPLHTSVKALCESCHKEIHDR